MKNPLLSNDLRNRKLAIANIFYSKINGILTPHKLSRLCSETQQNIFSYSDTWRVEDLY